MRGRSRTVRALRSASVGAQVSTKRMTRTLPRRARTWGSQPAAAGAAVRASSRLRLTGRRPGGSGRATGADWNGIQLLKAGGLRLVKGGRKKILAVSRASSHSRRTLSPACCGRSLIELSKLLDPGQNARRDKLSVLTDAIKEVTRLRSEAVGLQRLNKILEVRLRRSVPPRLSCVSACSSRWGLGVCGRGHWARRQQRQY